MKTSSKYFNGSHVLYILWYFLIVNEVIFLLLISVIFSTFRKYKRLPISFESSLDTIVKPE